MRLLTGLLFALCTTLCQAATITIDTGHGKHSLTTEQLLGQPDARDISVPDDVSYHRTMPYRAVPMKALLDGIAPGSHLQFTALDGFTAEIPASLILDAHGAEAYESGLHFSRYV